MSVKFVPSPVGVIRLESEGEFLIGVSICDDTDCDDTDCDDTDCDDTDCDDTDCGDTDAAGCAGSAAAAASSTEVLERARVQLLEYWAGRRTEFNLPLRLSGTVFQEEVWRALQTIPHGQTVSYGQIAQRINRPGAVRAVGQAVGANPLAIIVPCHRVVGSTGKLTGFSTGLGIETKQLLLDREGIFEYQV